MIRLIDGANRSLQAAARHEAAHAAAAFVLGWEPVEIELKPDGSAHCDAVAPEQIGAHARREQWTQILLAPSFHVGAEGAAADRLDADKEIRHLAKQQLFPFEWLRDRLRQRTRDLVATSQFRRAAQYVGVVLLERGYLGAIELAQLLGDARADCEAIARGVPPPIRLQRDEAVVASSR